MDTKITPKVTYSNFRENKALWRKVTVQKSMQILVYIPRFYSKMNLRLQKEWSWVDGPSGDIYLIKDFQIILPLP